LARATTGRRIFLSLCVLGALLSDPAHARESWLGGWALQKQDEVRASGDADSSGTNAFVTPEAVRPSPRAVAPLSSEAAARNAATAALYEANIGGDAPANLLWTGIETANPLTRGETYRWNALRDQGLFDADRRAKAIAALQSLGIANVRIGLANHEIDLDRPDSWADHDRFVADLAAAGLNLSLDLHHFGIEDRFRMRDQDGGTVPETSYYLHPEWPDYFARFAAAAYARYGGAIKAITLVNEPETTVGFNSEMWNGGFPGWGDPRHHQFYVDRAIAVAIAAVKARVAIERERRAGGGQPFYMHTEAAVIKPGRPDFNRFARFFPSDLILGQDWLMRADLDALEETSIARLAKATRARSDALRTSLDWLVETYVLHPQGLEERRAARATLVGKLRALRDLHLALKAEFAVTMKTDTVFAADYYAHNEAQGASGAWLNPEPQLYAAQVASGERAGLSPLIADYYARYGLPMMIGETGTPFYGYGARWHEELLLECAQAIADGVPLLGYTIYPLIDTYGWETALSVPKDQTTVNTGGVLTMDLEPRDFIRTLMQALDNRTAQAGAAVPAAAP
jgi:hypothetical protein